MLFRTNKPKKVWEPFPGSQERFLSCPVGEVLLHGSRGGGKTDVLLMDFLQGVGKGYGIDYKGLILREATTELGDVITKSRKWIPQIFPDATFHSQRKIWTFKDGETLWMNYARTEEDYWAYHGHSYSINSLNLLVKNDNELILAKDVKIGDFLKTLQGPKKVTKIVKEKKMGIKVSVFDSDSYLIGEQYQGVLHPLLTNAGWQRIGLCSLSQTFGQYSSESSLIAEVHKFLDGIHQEIQISEYLFSHNNLKDFSIYSLNRVQFSSVHQIYCQLFDMINRFLSSEGFDFCIDLNNLQASASLLNGEIFVKEYGDGLRNVLQLLLYCEFLTSLLLQIHQGHIRQHLSTLFGFDDKSFLHYQQKFLLFPQQAFFEKYQNSRQPILLSQVVQEQIAWNDTLCYVHDLWKGVLNSQSNYHGGFCCCDVQPLQVLGISQSSFPLKNGVPKPRHCAYGQRGVSDILSQHTHLSNGKISYIHPYTHESAETNHFLQSFSFSVSACNTPLEFIDFEIEEDNHYLSTLSNYDITNNHKSQPINLINQNCFIGFEELTNWPLPTIYLKLMSCLRTTNPNIPLKYRSTCNPSGVGHQWVKDRFINAGPPEKVIYDEHGQARTHIQSSLDENLALKIADPHYKSKLLTLTQDNKQLRDAWVYGSWDLLSGGFFSDVWDSKKQIIMPFQVPKSWKLIRSFDWGSSKPYCVTYGFEANGEQPQSLSIDPVPFIPKGSVIVCFEIYGWNGEANKGDGATTDMIASRIKKVDEALFLEYGIKVLAGPADNAIWEVRDGKSIGGELRKFGCHWTKSYKGSGSRSSGWAIIRQMLGASKRGDLETPHLYFFPAAVHHIRTIPILQRDKIKPEDINSEMEDHAADSLRYLLSRKLFTMSKRKVSH